MEAALRNQVLYGGRLGTNLVELGFLSLEKLSPFLADQTGVPVATPTLLNAAARPLLERLGAADAQRFGALPIGRLDHSTTVVAMVDPSNRVAVEAVGTKLATTVTPYVVPELRAAYYFEKHFGAPRQARFLRTATAEDPLRDPYFERRRAQPAGGLAMPPTFTVQPASRRDSRPQIVHPVPTTLMFATARERIETAMDREQIADALIDYAVGRCDVFVLLVPRERNAVGWRGFVAPPVKPLRAVSELSLPLGGASALQVAHDTGETYMGSPPSLAAPVEAALWSALGVSPPPSELAVFPVMVRREPVILMYAHCATGRLPASTLGEIQDLAECAQETYVRLMQQLWDC